MKKTTVSGAILATGVALLFMANPSFAQEAATPSAKRAGPTLKITITNLTGGPGGETTTPEGMSAGGQVFTPILVANHKAGVSLFTLGQPASVPLQDLAESGDTSMLKSALTSNPDVLDVQTTDPKPLPPGQSVTLTVKTKDGFDHISVAAMLVPTNAGFFALNDVEVPNGNKSITVYSPAYDAGSKADDELCANIPGPPNVCKGTGFINTPTGVGFVHIHSGIHGIGDLSETFFDWQNPVAQIVIQRVP